MLGQSPEPEAHDKVLDNNSDPELEFGKCCFLRRGENRSETSFLSTLLCFFRPSLILSVKL